MRKRKIRVKRINVNQLKKVYRPGVAEQWASAFRDTVELVICILQHKCGTPNFKFKHCKSGRPRDVHVVTLKCKNKK